MEWIKKMRVALIDLQNACKKNTEWANCAECPFGEWCDVLEEHGYTTPDKWKFE